MDLSEERTRRIASCLNSGGYCGVAPGTQNLLLRIYRPQCSSVRGTGASPVRRYPNTVLIDWHAASAGHPEFVERDGIHLTLQGAQAYADLIATHLAVP